MIPHLHAVFQVHTTINNITVNNNKNNTTIITMRPPRNLPVPPNPLYTNRLICPYQGCRKPYTYQKASNSHMKEHAEKDADAARRREGIALDPHVYLVPLPPPPFPPKSSDISTIINFLLVRGWRTIIN